MPLFGSLSLVSVWLEMNSTELGYLLTVNSYCVSTAGTQERLCEWGGGGPNFFWFWPPWEGQNENNEKMVIFFILPPPRKGHTWVSIENISGGVMVKSDQTICWPVFAHFLILQIYMSTISFKPFFLAYFIHFRKFIIIIIVTCLEGDAVPATHGHVWLQSPIASRRGLSDCIRGLIHVSSGSTAGASLRGGGATTTEQLNCSPQSSVCGHILCQSGYVSKEGQAAFVDRDRGWRQACFSRDVHVLNHVLPPDPEYLPLSPHVEGPADGSKSAFKMVHVSEPYSRIGTIQVSYISKLDIAKFQSQSY